MSLILYKQILLLVLLAGVTFCLSNFVLNGTLNKTANLSGELKSSPDSLYQWKISQEPPFKYRVLHRVIVKGTYQVVKGKQENNQLFFFIYGIEAFLFHLGAVLAFFFFLKQLDLSESAFTGALLFALLPPLSLAYNVPVHTREDTLAYLLLILGLSAILKNNGIQILLFAILGILCRETLLLIPFVNFFFNKKQRISVRLLIAIISFGIFLGLRFYLGTEPYHYWEGLTWNLNNPEQVVGFTYLTFGFLWLPFCLSFIRKWKVSPTASLIRDSGSYVFALIMATTFAGGIFNEIRLLYLLAPWIIVIALTFFSEHKDRIQSMLRKRSYRVFVLIALSLTTILSVILLLSVNQLAGHSKYDIPYATWIIVGAIQMFLGAVSLPVFFSILRIPKTNPS